MRVGKTSSFLKDYYNRSAYSELKACFFLEMIYLEDDFTGERGDGHFEKRYLFPEFSFPLRVL